jgi:hypothetical protein
MPTGQGGPELIPRNGQHGRAVEDPDQLGGTALGDELAERVRPEPAQQGRWGHRRGRRGGTAVGKFGGAVNHLPLGSQSNI